MQLWLPIRIGLFLLVSTSAGAADRLEQKPDSKGQSSVAYVVAGCGLMSLGLLFGHIRHKPVRRRGRL